MKQKLPSSILTLWSIWPAADKDFGVTIHVCNRKLFSPESPYYACIQVIVMMDMNRKIGVYHRIKYVLPRGGNRITPGILILKRFGIYVRKKEAVSRGKKIVSKPPNYCPEDFSGEELEGNQALPIVTKHVHHNHRIHVQCMT